MRTFLQAVADHGSGARQALRDAGYHPEVVYAKAVKAAGKDYTDYGVAADLPWLTDKGRAFLDDRTETR